VYTAATAPGVSHSGVTQAIVQLRDMHRPAPTVWATRDWRAPVEQAQVQHTAVTQVHELWCWAAMRRRADAALCHRACWAWHHHYTAQASPSALAVRTVTPTAMPSSNRKMSACSAKSIPEAAGLVRALGSQPLTSVRPSNAHLRRQGRRQSPSGVRCVRVGWGCTVSAGSRGSAHAHTTHHAMQSMRHEGPATARYGRHADRLSREKPPQGLRSGVCLSGQRQPPSASQCDGFVCVSRQA
jgi:hypothetical protein